MVREAEDKSTVETATRCGSVGFLWREVVAGYPTRRWRGEDELVDEPSPTKIYCCWCGRPVVVAGCCLGWLVTVVWATIIVTHLSAAVDGS